MIAVSQTKSANYLFIVAVLKSMRDGGVITPAEYERAKRYYQKLTEQKRGSLHEGTDSRLPGRDGAEGPEPGHI